MGQAIHSLFDLSGRVALVTGAGSGLGREFAQVLAESGADVICPDLYKDRAEETSDLIKKYGHKAIAVETDVSRYEQVQALFKLVEQDFGRLDILVNNAGITTRAALIDQIEVKDWHKVLDVNLHGVFYCMKEGLKIMMKQHKGSIINIASIAGINAVDPAISANAPYITSKAAVIGLTRQGAAEYGAQGIRVNCIAPGWYFGTRLAENAGAELSEADKKVWEEMIIARTPMRRTGEPRELKGLLLYLASDASSFVTGQVIAPDGGWTCW